jgi:hypothetical protein
MNNDSTNRSNEFAFIKRDNLVWRKIAENLNLLFLSEITPKALKLNFGIFLKKEVVEITVIRLK